ncbi:MAG: class I SAM-dependent methyltransferase [Acidobacteriaceae bacterium]|nr:class I SAM-dependent methyltransferase [Acidobacteriaceae bacterium]MBV9764073.1 class I SAM-dependent methyltransferase [Acidobacteriaceae bacterium]
MQTSQNRLASFVDRYLHASAYSAYAFTVGSFSSKGRSLISTICDHFGYFQESVPPLVPKIAVSEILDPNIAVQVREPLAADGNISLLELLIIDNLALQFKPKTMLEIGTFDGRTTTNLAANSGDDCEVYTLDLPKENKTETALPVEASDIPFMPSSATNGVNGTRLRFLNADCRKKITQLYGDSASFDFTPFYGSVDLVFVDGSHSYEYAVNDTGIALRLLRNGKGLILWHDYGVCWPGVTRALNEFYSKGGDFGGLRHIEGTSLACLSLR